MHFVFRTKELLAAISLDLFAVLFGGAVALIPVYARDILKVGAEGFGLLNGASDIGSICIVILLTIFPPRRKQGLKLLIAVAGFGTCIIIFGLSKLFWLSFVVLLISGLHGWHQCRYTGHHHATENTGQYARTCAECQFHVHQFQ